MLDELEEGLLAPLDVVEDAEERLLGRPRLQQLAEGPGDLVGRRHRVSFTQHGLKGVPGGAVDERLGSRDLFDDLDDRPVGDALAVGEAAAADHRRAVDPAQELGDEPRLADACRPQDREEMAGALAGDVVEGVPEEVQLAVSPHHGDVSPTDERRRFGVER